IKSKPTSRTGPGLASPAPLASSSTAPASKARSRWLPSRRSSKANWPPAAGAPDPARRNVLLSSQLSVLCLSCAAMIRARSLGREGRKRRTSEKGGFERRPAPMLRIGIHTSIASSLASAAEKAAALGCNTFQIFSASPRMWRGSKLDPAEVRLFREAREKHDLFPLVIHDN